jgi:hypothetical protein
VTMCKAQNASEVTAESSTSDGTGLPLMPGPV